MQNENNTASKKRQEQTRLTLQESFVVEHPNTNRGFTYTIPASALARCFGCQAVVARVTLISGYMADLDLEIDQGQPRAILTSPHVCGDVQ